MDKMLTLKLLPDKPGRTPEQVLISDDGYPLCVVHIDNFFPSPFHAALGSGLTVTVKAEFTLIDIDRD